MLNAIGDQNSEKLGQQIYIFSTIDNANIKFQLQKKYPIEYKKIVTIYQCVRRHHSVVY